MKAWVPVEKRAVIERLAKEWGGQPTFSVETLESMLGFFRYLDLVLRVFVEVLERVQLFVNKCRRECEEKQIKRVEKVWRNDKMKMWSEMLVGALRAASWTVPIIDWEWDGRVADVEVRCDAACPKARGLDYEGAEWGGGGWVEGRWFYAVKFSAKVLDKAKRSSQLSAAYLEAVNYVRAVEVACEMGARRVRVVGDCQPALSWLSKLSFKLGKASDATRIQVKELIATYVRIVVRNGMHVHVMYVERNELKVADALSRGDEECVNRLRASGLQRVGAECDTL
jgi:hypothetical protein